MSESNELSDATKKALDSLGSDVTVKEGVVRTLLERYGNSHAGRLTDVEFDALLREIDYDIRNYDRDVAVAKIVSRVLTHAIRWGAVCLLT